MAGTVVSGESALCFRSSQAAWKLRDPGGKSEPLTVAPCVGGPEQPPLKWNRRAEGNPLGGRGSGEGMPTRQPALSISRVPSMTLNS